MIKTYITGAPESKDEKDKHEDTGDHKEHVEEYDHKAPESPDKEEKEKHVTHEEKYEKVDEHAMPEQHDEHKDDHGPPEHDNKDVHEEKSYDISHDDGGKSGDHEEKHEEEKKEEPFPYIVQTFDFQHVPHGDDGKYRSKPDAKHDQGYARKYDDDDHEYEHKTTQQYHDDYEHTTTKHDHDDKKDKHDPDDYDRKKKKHSQHHETKLGKKFEFDRDIVTTHEYTTQEGTETTKPYTSPYTLPIQLTSLDGVFMQSSTLDPEPSTSDPPASLFFVPNYAEGPNINNYFPDYPEAGMNYSDGDNRPPAHPYFHVDQDDISRKQKGNHEYYDDTRVTDPPLQQPDPNVLYDPEVQYENEDPPSNHGYQNYQKDESNEVTISPVSFSKFVDSLSPNFHFIPLSDDFGYDHPDQLTPGVTYLGRHHHVNQQDGEPDHQHEHSPPQSFTYQNHPDSRKNKKKKTSKIRFQTIPVNEKGGDEEAKMQKQHDLQDPTRYDADPVDLEQHVGGNNGRGGGGGEEIREPIQKPDIVDVEPFVFHQLPDLGADHAEEDPPEDPAHHAAPELDHYSPPPMQQQEDPEVNENDAADYTSEEPLHHQQQEQPQRLPKESSHEEELDSFIPKSRPDSQAHNPRYTDTTGPRIVENENTFEYGNHFSYDDEFASPEEEQQHQHTGKPEVDFYDPGHDDRVYAASYKDYNEHVAGGYGGSTEEKQTYLFAVDDDFNNFFPSSSKKVRMKQITLKLEKGKPKKEKAKKKKNQIPPRHPVSSMNTDVKAFLFSHDYDMHPEMLEKAIPSFPSSMEIKDHVFSSGPEPDSSTTPTPLVTHMITHEPASTITTQQAYHRLKNNMLSPGLNQSQVSSTNSPIGNQSKSIKLLKRRPDEQRPSIKHDSIGSQLRELRKQEEEEEEMNRTTTPFNTPFKYTYITRKPVAIVTELKDSSLDQNRQNHQSDRKGKSLNLVRPHHPARNNSKLHATHNKTSKSNQVSSKAAIRKPEPVTIRIPESPFFDSFLSGIDKDPPFYATTRVPKPKIKLLGRKFPHTKVHRKQQSVPAQKIRKGKRKQTSSITTKALNPEYYLPVKKHTKITPALVQHPAPKVNYYSIDDEISSILSHHEQETQQRQTTTPSPYTANYLLPSPFDSFVTDFEPYEKRSTKKMSHSRAPTTSRPTMASSAAAFDDASFTAVRKIIDLPRTKKENNMFPIKRLDKSASHSHDDHKDHKDREGTKSEEPFPYQYNIEIRKRKKKVSVLHNKVPGPRGPVHYLAAASGDGKGVREGREKHVDRDLELNKYRMVENKEEEHWHEKKWHKEDLKEEYVNGKPVPVKVQVRPKYIGQGEKEEEAAKDSHIPFYARPLDPFASKKVVDEHFSVPSPGFRVDKAFESWVKKDVE